jgi:predicted MFS family arabinose efflux permease
MGQTLGWTSPLIIGSFAASMALFLILVWAERRAKDPVISTELFKNKKLLRANILSMAIILPYAGSMVVLPLYFQNIRGISVIDAGLLIMCISLGLFNPAAFQYVLDNSPKEVKGTASGMLQTSRRVSTVIGVAMMSAVYNTVFASSEIPTDSGSDITLSPHFLHDFAIGTVFVIILIGCLVALAIVIHDARKAATE